MGVSENVGTLFRGPSNKDPLFKVLYSGPQFSETPIFACGEDDTRNTIQTSKAWASHPDSLNP